MAGAGDRLPVNCGISLKGNSIVVSYKVGKNVDKKNISWQWIQQEDNYVASLEARTTSGDVKYHNSDPIPAAIHASLGSPDKSKDGEYYTVKMKKKSEVPDLSQYFDVTQH